MTWWGNPGLQPSLTVTEHRIWHLWVCASMRACCIFHLQYLFSKLYALLPFSLSLQSLKLKKPLPLSLEWHVGDSGEPRTIASPRGLGSEQTGQQGESLQIQSKRRYSWLGELRTTRDYHDPPQIRSQEMKNVKRKNYLLMSTKYYFSLSSLSVESPRHLIFYQKGKSLSNIDHNFIPPHSY